MLWVFLAFVLAGALVFAGLLRTAARWGKALIELQQFGVETAGVVLRKTTRSSKGSRSRSLKYEYRDQFGSTHTRTVLVTEDAWDTLQEGGPIEVIYSQRHPKISAPKYLIDVMKSAKVTVTINDRS